MFAFLDFTKRKEAALKAEGFDFIPVHRKLIPDLLDLYGLGLAMVVLPISIVFWIILTAIGMIPAFFTSIYVPWCLERPLDRVPDGLGFHIFRIINAPFALLAFCVGCFYWALAFGLIMGASLPVALLRLLCGQYYILKENFRLLGPHMSGGKISYDDTLRAMIGEADRRGAFSFFLESPFGGGFASAVTVVPILKYCFGANPFLYELEELYINQWTPKLTNLTKPQVRHFCQTKAGRSKHQLEVRAIVQMQRFSPHYPFGPSYGVETALGTHAVPESVVGIQYLNCHPKLAAFTKTTWAKDHDKPRSDNASHPCFRVELHWFNLHFLTGYVEVNVSKIGGWEHPMWCIVPKHSKMGRELYAFANTLFVPWMKESVILTEMMKDDFVRDVKINTMISRKSIVEVESEIQAAYMEDA